MERTSLSHAQIDDCASMELIICFKHPEGYSKRDVDDNLPTIEQTDRVLNEGIRSGFTVEKMGVLEGESSDIISTVRIRLSDGIFKVGDVVESLNDLDEFFSCPAEFHPEFTRIKVSEDNCGWIKPFSKPTVVYEAHVNHTVPADEGILDSSLENLEATFSEFDQEGMLCGRVDCFVGDRNIIYVATSKHRNGIIDAIRVSELVDSTLSSKAIQYNGVYASMLDSPRMKDL